VTLIFFSQGAWQKSVKAKAFFTSQVWRYSSSLINKQIKIYQQQFIWFCFGKTIKCFECTLLTLESKLGF